MPNDPLSPPPVRAGYVRLAVAQIASHPAAVINSFDLLRSPFGTPKSFFDAAPTFSDQNQAPVSDREAGIRRAYIHGIQGKLVAIASQCARWGIQVLAFPEYAVPFDCISALLPHSQSMIIVAGSHFVTSASQRLARDQCWPAVERGWNVAPVLWGGTVAAWVPKQCPAKPELTSITAGTCAQPLQLPSSPIDQLTVRICMDLLQDRMTDGPDRLVVCPARTTPGSIESDFLPKLREHADRFHGVVMLASDAGTGGSTIVRSQKSPDGLFPAGIASLDAHEEGVLVVDIDFESVPRAETTPYALKPSSYPVAAAGLVYTSTSKGARVAESFATMPVLDDDDGLKQWLDGLPRVPSAARDRRHRMLRMNAQTLSAPEAAAQLLREIILPVDVLPIPEIQRALAQGLRRYIDSDNWTSMRKEQGALLDTLERSTTRTAHALTTAGTEAFEWLTDLVYTRPTRVPIAMPPPDDVDAAFREARQASRDGRDEDAKGHALSVLERAKREERTALAINRDWKVREAQARFILAHAESDASLRTELLRQVDAEMLPHDERLRYAYSCIEHDLATPDLPADESRLLELFRSLFDTGAVQDGAATTQVPEELPGDPSIRKLAAMKLWRNGDYARAAEITLAMLADGAAGHVHQLATLRILIWTLAGSVLEEPRVGTPIPREKRRAIVRKIDDTLPRLQQSALSARWKERLRSIELQFFGLTADDEALARLAPEQPTRPARPTTEWGKRLIALGPSPEIDALLALAAEYPDKLPVEYQAAQTCLNNERRHEAVEHAKRAYEALPGLGQALLLARASWPDLEVAWQRLRDFETRPNMNVQLVLSEIDEALSGPAQALKRFERFPREHELAWVAAACAGNLRSRIEDGRRGADQAWDAVRDRLPQAQTWVLARVVEAQHAPVDQADAGSRLRAIEEALSGRTDIESLQLRLRIRRQAPSATRMMPIDITPYETAGIVQRLPPAMAAEFAEREGSITRELESLYDKGLLSLEGWATALSMDHLQLARRLIELRRWRAPLIWQHPAFERPTELLVGAAEVALFFELEVLDEVLAYAPIVMMEDAFEHITRSFDPGEHDSACLARRLDAARADARLRTVERPIVDATTSDDLAALLTAPWSYPEFLLKPGNETVAMVTAEFATANVFNVPNSMGAQFAELWPPGKPTGPYLRLGNVGRIASVTRLLDALGVSPDKLLRLVDLGFFDAITPKLVSHIGLEAVPVRVSELIARLKNQPFALDDLGLLGPLAWRIISAVWTHPGSDVHERWVYARATMAEFAFSPSMTPLLTAAAVEQALFRPRTISLGEHHLSDLFEDFARNDELVMAQTAFSAIDFIVNSLRRLEVKESAAIVGGAIQAIITVAGRKVVDLQAAFTAPAYFAGLMLSAASGRVTSPFDWPPVTDMIDLAVEHVVRVGPVQLKFVHNAVPIVLPFGTREVTVLVPFEVLALQIDAAIVAPFLERFAAATGADDGSLYDAAVALKEDPKDPKRRWQFAFDVLSARAWRVRACPELIGLWAGRVDHSSVIGLKRNELLGMLSEPRVVAPSESLASQLRARFEEGGAWHARLDARELWHVVQTMPFSARNVLRAQDSVEHDPDPIDLADRTLRQLERMELPPAAQTCSMLVIVGAVASEFSDTERNGRSLRLRERYTDVLVQLLDVRPETVDGFYRFEPEVARLCALVVANVDLRAGAPRLELVHGRWIALRLYEWLTRQLRAKSPEARRAALEALSRQAKVAGLSHRVSDDVLDAWGWGPEGLDIHVASVLQAIRAIAWLDETEDGWQPHSEALEDHLVRLASRPMTATESASSAALDDTARSGLLLGAALGVDAITVVPELAMICLIAARPEAFMTLSPEVRLRWIECLGRSGTGQRFEQLAVRVVQGLYACDASLADNERARFADFVKAWLQHGTTAVWLVPAMIVARIQPSNGPDAGRLLLDALLAGDHRTTAALEMIATLSERGESQFEAELRQLLALADPNQRTRVLIAMGRLLLEEGHPGHATALAVITKVAAEEPFSRDVQVRLFLANLDL